MQTKHQVGCHEVRTEKGYGQRAHDESSSERVHRPTRAYQPTKPYQKPTGAYPPLPDTQRPIQTPTPDGPGLTSSYKNLHNLPTPTSDLPGTTNPYPTHAGIACRDTPPPACGTPKVARSGPLRAHTLLDGVAVPDLEPLAEHLKLLANTERLTSILRRRLPVQRRHAHHLVPESHQRLSCIPTDGRGYTRPCQSNFANQILQQACRRQGAGSREQGAGSS